MDHPKIRAATLADAEQVAAIYNHYVLHTTVTFEEETVSAEAMAGRIGDVLRSWVWLVIESDQRLLGYAYSSAWKPRTAYRYSTECTIYLHPDHTGRGLGRLLYSQLLVELRAKGAHAVIGGIALPNLASQRLHEKLGFKKVAQFEQVGWKFGRWIDVGYWELALPFDPGSKAK